ncbi:SPOCS domain-containing protein [Haloimpatiens lingqiaonensis]|uniref:SPOCS domain-containing protein n=1 Tax=Haloimpatiens lingqiaonensis TaxID=1380675 RepID=UPI0010FD32F7|nr:SPOCS domain-containing protein [Haloimpatiens lingqiaonensis]
MKNTTIKINGLISQKQLSNYNIQYPCKEICKSYHITLPENKPNIQLILELSLNAQISNYKHIFTHGKNKIFIEGFLNSKLFFKSNLYSKNIYYTEFSRPFSEILPIENVNTFNLKPTIFIEEAFINHINEKSFSISILMVICEILNNNESPEKNIDIISNNNLKIPSQDISANSNHNLQMPVDYINATSNNNLEIPVNDIDVTSNNNLQMPVDDIDAASNNNLQMPVNDINTASNNNLQMSVNDINTASNNNLQTPIKDTNMVHNNSFQIPVEDIHSYLKDNLQIPSELINNSLKTTSKEQEGKPVSVTIEYDMNTSEECFK